MFRRSINIFIVMILLAGTTGYSISIHYCGKSLISVSLNEKAESCCGSECDQCRDENQHYQIDDDFISAHYSIPNQLSANDIDYPILIVSDLEESTEFTQYSIYSNDSSPPANRAKQLAALQTYLL